jgi:hypothetical protein
MLSPDFVGLILSLLCGRQPYTETEAHKVRTGFICLPVCNFCILAKGQDFHPRQEVIFAFWQFVFLPPAGKFFTLAKM